MKPPIKTTLTSAIAALFIAALPITPAMAAENAAIQGPADIITYGAPLFVGVGVLETVSTTCLVSLNNWRSAVNHSTATIQFWADNSCTIPTVDMKPGESVPVRLPGVHTRYTALTS